MDEESGYRAHPRSQSWSRKHRVGIAGEAGCCPRYCVLCQPGNTAPVTWSPRAGDRTSLLDFSPATSSGPSTEGNTFLNFCTILTLFLHTLYPLRRINCQIISFLNVQASDINVLYRAITPGGLT